MTYDELNNFIKNYLENDNTGRAIMLNGTWGSGKSYYINNELIPYLKRKECGKHKCAVVSLYGLNEISEISKSIYISLRTIKKIYKIKNKKEKIQNRKRANKNKKSELFASTEVAGKIVAKTIMNGIVSKVGFEIGQSDSDFKQVYKSINLNGKLIIFEDVERSGINLIDFLGFVNNLTEQDGIKVLLVANEEELIKTVDAKDDKKYTEETENYLQIKEKTICDTINFQCNLQSSIKSIYEKFSDENKFFNDYSDAESINYLLNNVLTDTDINFRLVIIACQKITDILKYIKNQHIEITKEFRNCIVYSILAYTHSTAYKDKSYFDFQYLSQQFGTQDEPLPKFAYNYVINQSLEKKEIELCQEEFKTFTLYRNDSTIPPNEFLVIYNCWIYTEDEVKQALQNINICLKSNNISVSFYELGKLSSYLVFILHELEIKEAAECIENLLAMFKGKTNINTHYLFVNEMILEGNTQKEYEILKDKIIRAINSVNLLKIEIEYTIEWMDMFFNAPEKYIKNWISIILNLNITKFTIIIKDAPPKLIQDIRYSFKSIYAYSNIHSEKEKNKIQELMNQLDQCKNTVSDNVVKYQIKKFIAELSGIYKLM